MPDALVLLAGFSRRMGQLKQHTRLAGHTFLETIISRLTACRSKLRHLLFVGQAEDEISQKLVEEIGGIWLVNPAPERGPLSSVRIAIEHCSDDFAKLLWPIDHPLVASSTVEKLIELWQSCPECITIPSTGTRRGHPSIFPAWCCREFFDIDLNEGAKALLNRHPDRINHLLTNDPWIRKNLNTPEMLAEAEIWLQTNQVRSSIE
jgi:molybdenum cofactor cytidylyltransferase